MKIVVGVDGSGASTQALRYAAAEAKATGAELEAVTVWELAELAASHVSQEQVDDAMGPWLADFLTEKLGDDAAEVSQTVRGGRAAGVLLAEAENADLLVVGSGTYDGIAAVFMGSVSHQLANHTPCPLTVVPDGTDDSGTKELAVDADGPIVVAVDGSASADAALHWAADRAVRCGSTLKVVLAWQGVVSDWNPGPTVTSPPIEPADLHQQAHDMLADLVTKAALPSALEPELVLGEGAPNAVIHEAAEGASMVVLGARGRGGFLGLLLGSVTSRMLNDIKLPTTVIPAS